jgi:(1->4)-alpha-D-glucan 1-alpha-D-glucosylmutase
VWKTPRFYRDNTLLALNEVGGNPANSSLNVREFHHFNEQRAKDWPNSMTATSTHDTKLSEDARIRIATISVFRTRVGHRGAAVGARSIRPYRADVAPRVVSGARDEYRFYQALVGMWNDEMSMRMAACRRNWSNARRLHAKVRARAQLCTSGFGPNADYEDGLESFVRRVLLDDGASEFRQSVAAFVQLIER